MTGHCDRLFSGNMRNGWNPTGRLALCFAIAIVHLAARTAYSQAATPRPAATAGANTNRLEIVPLGRTELTTLDGKTYKGVILQKVDPDGLIIRYTSAGGGMGAVKVKFKNLPADLQQKYKYNPEAAATYEAQQTRLLEAWRAQREAQVKAARQAATRRAQQEAAEAQRKAKIDQRANRAEGNDGTGEAAGAKGNPGNLVRNEIRGAGGKDNELIRSSFNSNGILKPLRKIKRTLVRYWHLVSIFSSIQRSNHLFEREQLVILLDAFNATARNAIGAPPARVKDFVANGEGVCRMAGSVRFFRPFAATIMFADGFADISSPD